MALNIEISNKESFLFALSIAKSLTIGPDQDRDIYGDLTAEVVLEMLKARTVALRRTEIVIREAIVTFLSEARGFLDSNDRVSAQYSLMKVELLLKGGLSVAVATQYGKKLSADEVEGVLGLTQPTQKYLGEGARAGFNSLDHDLRFFLNGEFINSLTEWTKRTDVVEELIAELKVVGYLQKKKTPSAREKVSDDGTVSIQFDESWTTIKVVSTDPENRKSIHYLLYRRAIDAAISIGYVTEYERTTFYDENEITAEAILYSRTRCRIHIVCQISHQLEILVDVKRTI